MRGKGDANGIAVFLCRITPAYAGKSAAVCGAANLGQDHPRLCGEKKKSGYSCAKHVGSPPPMRGKDSRCSELACDAGITPAYAGKSVQSSLTRQRRRDHPRLCGEKDGAYIISDFLRGSPPPMRGKDCKLQSAVLFQRITPAYAGKRANDT